VFYRRTHRSRYISTESEHVLEQKFINVYEKIDCIKNYNGKSITYFNVIKYT